MIKPIMYTHFQLIYSNGKNRQVLQTETKHNYRLLVSERNRRIRQGTNPNHLLIQPVS